MSILVCIQARMGSSRLPGKVMMPLAARPLLQRMVERVRAAKLCENVVVLTTEDSADDEIVRLCNEMETNVFRGHATDLLDRHYQAARFYHADGVVKIPSDCPLIDPAIIDRVLGYYRDHSADYDFVSDLHPATYPDGNDVEVMSIGVLAQAWAEAQKPFEREHTTPFIWERPDRYRIANLTWETGQNYSMTHRWTIDYPEDYEFISRVYAELWNEKGDNFGLEDILRLIEKKPEIAAINQKYAGLNWYRHHLEELHTITSADTRLETNNA